MQKKATVIGIGRLGLCFALTLEKAGYNVCGCDINVDYINSLNDYSFISSEPEVNERLRQTINIFFSTNIEDGINHSDIIFITVRTTSREDGSYDCSQVENVINQLKKLGKQKNTKYLILSSNVNPGFSNKMSDDLLEYGYKVNFNPEWVAQGTILYNQSFPDLVVIGEHDKESGDIIESIYKDMCENDPSIHKMDRLSAEITKVCLNCTLATKITLANMIGDIAVKNGVKPEPILNAIGEDSRIGKKYFKYGFGFGGPCFPRDVRALIKHMDDCDIPSNVVHEVREYNKYHLDFQVEMFKIAHSPDENIMIDYVSYKPGIPILEESQQLLFAVKLAQAGYKITIVEDPKVIEEVKNEYGNLFLYEERISN